MDSFFSKDQPPDGTIASLLRNLTFLTNFADLYYMSNVLNFFLYGHKLWLIV
jgi:hypothetical protein